VVYASLGFKTIVQVVFVTRAHLLLALAITAEEISVLIEAGSAH